MLKVFAPGRVELLGNHTDYNEGYVLSFAVDRGVTITGQLRPDQRIILEAVEMGDRYEGSTESVAPSATQGWANYPLGVVAQFQKRGIKVPGFEIEIRSNLPMGAGLSSSAALETATALFLQTSLNTSFAPLELAKIGQAAEHEFVGVKCGLLDQISSVFGQENHVTFIDCRTYEVQRIPLSSEVRFILANSHAKHALVTGEYNERRASCEAAARALNLAALRDATSALLESQAYRLDRIPLMRARHIVGENERVQAAIAFLKNGQLERLGELMFASHRSSQENFENSCPELDALVAAARQTSGCLGARLMGGGFGGASLNLMRAGAEEKVSTALLAACPGAECLQTKASGGAAVVT